MNDDQNEGLNERLDYLELAVRDQIARLYRIEQQLGIGQQESHRVPPPAPPVARIAPTAPPVAPVAPVQVAEVRPAISHDTTRMAAQLEQRIGGSWFSKIGMVAIILSTGFFVKYAFDRQWIGPGQRVLAGLAAGFVLLFFGERLRAKGMRAYAQVISGGGVAILYLSIFAAYDFYQLIPHTVAFICMVAIALLATWLAVRQNARLLAIIGLVGAFLTPVVLSKGENAQVALYSYLIILNLSVLAVAHFKGWRSLDYLAFVATAQLSIGWAFEWFEPPLVWSTIGFLTALFLIFALVPFAHAIGRHAEFRRFDIALIIANGVVTTFLVIYALGKPHEAYYGLAVALFAIPHALIAGLLYSWERSDRRLVIAYTGMAIGYLTLFIPAQFDRQTVTILLAIEALAILGCGFRFSLLIARAGAFVVFGLALFHWFVVDVSGTGTSWRSLLIARGSGCLTLIASFVIASRWYRRSDSLKDSLEGGIAPEALIVAANVLALIGISLEARNFYRDDEFAQQMSLSIIYTLYGAVLLAAGVLRSRRSLRLIAISILALTTLKVFLVDLQQLDKIYRITSFFALGAILLVVSYFYQRNLRRSSLE